MIRLLLTTFEDPDAAAAVIRTLVEERRIACGSILPGVRSIYRWQDTIEDSAEVMVLLKTTAAALPGLRDRLQDLHPYETPEILTLDPSGVSPAYADWLAQQCATE